MAVMEGGERQNKLKFILKAIADIYYPASNLGKPDSSGTAKNEGITSVKFLNAISVLVNKKPQIIEGYPNVAPNQVNALMKRLKYEGLSELGHELEKKVLKPFVRPHTKGKDGNYTKNMRKPLLAIIITDGEVSVYFYISPLLHAL